MDKSLWLWWIIYFWHGWQLIFENKKCLFCADEYLKDFIFHLILGGKIEQATSNLTLYVWWKPQTKNPITFQHEKNMLAENVGFVCV